MMLVAVVFFLLLAGTLAFLSGDLPATVFYALTVVLCLVGMGLDFRQYHKLEEYIDSVYLDCYPAVERAERKGPMVFAAFFGWIPLGWIVKNHKYITANRGTFYRIHREQDQRADKTFHSDFLHDWQ